MSEPVPQILLVEDNRSVAEPIRLYLECIFKCKVIIAEDGAHGWWFLSDPNRKFELCISDLELPNISGMQLLTRIRETPDLRYLKFFFCTAWCTPELVWEATSLKVNGFIVKPVLTAELKTRFTPFLEELPNNDSTRKSSSIILNSTHTSKHVK